MLKRLSHEQHVRGDDSSIERMPFSLYFEQLCSATAGENRIEKKYDALEFLVKEKISEVLDVVPHNKLHVQFADLFDVILTTNYDYTLENTLGPFGQDKPVSPESKYSLFRRTLNSGKSIWHIHGELHRPNSIVLGYDHYVGYVQKIRNYVTTGIDVSNVEFLVRSPFANGIAAFEEGKYYSWVDHFLRDTVHIVGLGLDFSEVDLWWLLLNKWRRGSPVSGKTYFYDINSGEGRKSARNSLLQSFGVTLVSVSADSYESGYEKIFSEVKRIVSLPEERLFPINMNLGWQNDPWIFDTESKPAEDLQSELNFGRKRRGTKKRKS